MGTVTEVRTGQQLRARRRRKLAEEIELAALRLFAEHGIDAVTVDEIAAAADISRRSFFRYFASKDDLLHGNPERHFDTVRGTIEATSAECSLPSLVRAIMLALADAHSHDREALRLRMRIAADSPEAFAGRRNLPGLVETIIESVAAHTGRDADTDLALRTFVHAGFGAVQAAARIWFTTDTGRSLHDLTAETLDLIHLR